MDLIFNELSEFPKTKNKTIAFERVDKFISTYKSANNHGFNKIRFHKGFEAIELSDNFTLNDFCNEPQNRLKATLLRGLFRHPFIDENSAEEDGYILNNFELKREEIKINTYGLAAAYLYSTLGISFLSEDFWGNCRYTITITGNNNLEVSVYSVSMPEHFDDVDILKFIEGTETITLTKTDIPIKNKKISLRDDHGKDILLRFANKLISSPYVISVINSLPFNPYERNFIKKIYPNGIIEIVLTKTDKGLGLIIETTGNTIKETDAIANILAEQFSS